MGTYWADRGGKRVAVQDMEVDGLSASFVENLGHPNLSLYENGQEYDYVLIDTEGNLSNEELGQVEKIAHRIVIPIKLTAADIAKVHTTAALLTESNKAHLLVNMYRENTSAWRDREHALKNIPLKRLKSSVRYVAPMNTCLFKDGQQ